MAGFEVAINGRFWVATEAESAGMSCEFAKCNNRFGSLRDRGFRVCRINSLSLLRARAD